MYLRFATITQLLPVAQVSAQEIQQQEQIRDATWFTIIFCGLICAVTLYAAWKARSSKPRVVFVVAIGFFFGVAMFFCGGILHSFARAG